MITEAETNKKGTMSSSPNRAYHFTIAEEDQVQAFRAIFLINTNILGSFATP